MLNWATIGFQMGFRSIERAYQESRKTFEREKETVRLRMDEFRASSAAATDDDDDCDYADHLVDLDWEAEQSLRTLREAFVTMIYHFWENQCRTNLGGKEFKKWIGYAKDRPEYQFDEAGLTRLRMIVNCVKHGDAKQGNRPTLHQVAPELFDAALVHTATEEDDFRIALRLRDEDVTAAFAAVKASGHQSDYTGEGPEEFVL
ncbi:hypothetical protein [Rhizobium laguerreae]|uniref:hypothetical protein n=1 Tax=Rhizobium laguerreae TaxID=1076926 RepID=UPI001C900701|nr:hypothetical protein [Rhizobium laguerreae]MBY3389214.1 hypothetical protein [Rhizobium laguerreae]MBY3402965.1 hypothetical protein [Rhizobium laguerreae]MBY3409904.1 hypothetical protein [Rhizobium laguerreae]